MKISFEAVAGKYLDSVMPDEEAVRKFVAANAKALDRVGHHWMNESIANAPRGPEETMLRRLAKSGGSYTVKATRTKPARTIKLTDFYRLSAAAIARRKKGTISGEASGLKARIAGEGWKNPGGLERSIKFQSGADSVEVYVASNAEAGEYAHIIHDMKGQKWHERGPGTQAKGEQADDKFIERAQPEAAERLRELMARNLKELFGG